MSLGSLLKKASRAVKKNPELALVVFGVVAPGLARKAAPKIIGAATKAKIVKDLVNPPPVR